MKIAMIGQRGVRTTYSGIDTWVEEISQRLSRRGHEVTVFCRKRYSKQDRDDFGGVKLVYLPCICTKHLETLSHGLLASLYTAFNGYEVVHYHGLASSALSILPRMFSKKSVLTVQGLDWKARKWCGFAKALLRFCECVSDRFPNETVVVSRTLLKHYERKYRRKVHYIPNGTNIRDSSLVMNGSPLNLKERGYLLYVGRLAPQKGLHYLISAFRKLDTSKKLVIVGGSSYTDKYVDYIKKLAAGDERVIFAGSLSGIEKDRVFAGAYLFVLPSEVEGLSLSLLEAMGHGRCCLVSDISENLEAIGDAGFSFRAGNASDLGEKIEMLLADPDLTDEMGRKAQVRARESYSWERIADRVEALYRQVIRQRTYP